MPETNACEYCHGPLVSNLRKRFCTVLCGERFREEGHEQPIPTGRPARPFLQGISRDLRDYLLGSLL